MTDPVPGHPAAGPTRVRCKLNGMDNAHESHHHDNAHALTRGQSIGLTLFIVIGCLVCIYIGLIIGDIATM